MAAIARWHERQSQDETLATRLRDIQDVLSDCDSKLHELERHLAPEPQPLPPAPKRVRKRRAPV
jgi:hypothetical protein